MAAGGPGRSCAPAPGASARSAPMDFEPATPEPDPVAGPEEGREVPFFPTGIDVGYHTAMEVRFVHGAFTEPGPALAWMRMRVPLVEGEEPEPLHRVLVAADSGNGVSSPLDYREWMFINADVSVTLRRHPDGEWVGLDASTYPEADGVGMSDTRLRDERGMIGRANQACSSRPRTSTPASSADAGTRTYVDRMLFDLSQAGSGLLAALALLPASASAALAATGGADLNRPVGCRDQLRDGRGSRTPGHPPDFSLTDDVRDACRPAPARCGRLPDTESSLGHGGTGTVTKVRVKSGPNPAPLQVMRSSAPLYTTNPNNPNEITDQQEIRDQSCCTVRASGRSSSPPRTP